jgi:insulysin
MTPSLKLLANIQLWHRVYAVLVTDALNEYSYDADLAGLTYSFKASSLGFYISVSGYNDKLHVLLRDVLGKAKSLEIHADRLEVMVEKVSDVLRLLSNTQLVGPTVGT